MRPMDMAGREVILKVIYIKAVLLRSWPIASAYLRPWRKPSTQQRAQARPAVGQAVPVGMARERGARAMSGPAGRR